MDIVCPVRPGDDNDELRLAIRSWETNLVFDRLVIVGYKPSWLQPDLFIEGNHAGYHANVYNNIRLACDCDDVADQILVTNDDFHVTSPTTPEPMFRCLLAEHLTIPRVKRGGWWKQSLETTMVCLQAHGIADPISYELHTPFPASKQLMAQTLTRFQHVTPTNPPQWRSLYGNTHHIGGRQADDVKTTQAGKIKKPYHSTDDRFFPCFKAELEAMFPQPSRYEQPEALAA